MNNLKSSTLFLRRFLTVRSASLYAFKPHTKRLLTSIYTRGFASTSHAANAAEKETYNPFTALVTRSDASLASAMEWDETMKSIEDRYHLSKINDVKKVFSLLRQANYKYPLNDLVHFLRRIVELSDEKHLHLNTHNSIELSSFVDEIKRNLRQGNQEYPLIGSYAWCFWKLNHKEDTELWLTLGDHIIDGRFHPNFNESLCGIEGFTALEGIAEPSFIDQVYKSLERVLILTILEVNITHYKRLTESLVKVHQFADYVFDNIEQHLIHFISTHSLEFDLRLMLDILAAFAISGNGSEHLFYSFQAIFNNFYGLEPEQQEELSHGDFISKLVLTYALAKTKHPDLVYDETFAKLVYELVTGEDAHYTLDELVSVVEHIPMFDFENLDAINQRLHKRLFNVKGDMKGDDMVRYIDLKVARDHEEDYAQLPQQVMAFFDDYLNKNMDKQKHDQVYYYINEVENRSLMKGKEELMNHLIGYVSSRLHIYDFEDLCYFYWLFNKYYSLIKSSDAKIQCELSQIKDHIRLYSAFSKGRLQIGSNFYKMLEVVSGSDFLSQGEYPDW